VKNRVWAQTGPDGVTLKAGTSNCKAAGPTVPRGLISCGPPTKGYDEWGKPGNELEGNIPSFTSTFKHENIDEPGGGLQEGGRAYTFLSRSYRARYREHNDLS
jgi:hypothetical protein